MNCQSSVFLVGISLILVLIAVWFILFYKKRSAPFENGSRKFIISNIKGENFRLEVSGTNAKRGEGLMWREVLKENEGMLFVFPRSGIYPFWMKNTLIPLDIIWLNEDKEVVYVRENMQPCSGVVGAICKAIVPSGMAKYVIEINAGDVERLGVKVGDRIGLSGY